VAPLFAAVLGILLVVIPGTARIIQLRIVARRHRASDAAGAAGPPRASTGPDGSTRGGHLLHGQVWPTLEVIIRETPAELRKTDRPDMGLALIDLGS
jgi:hypothetical protein